MSSLSYRYVRDMVVEGYTHDTPERVPYSLLVIRQGHQDDTDHLEDHDPMEALVLWKLRVPRRGSSLTPRNFWRPFFMPSSFLDKPIRETEHLARRILRIAALL